MKLYAKLAAFISTVNRTKDLNFKCQQKEQANRLIAEYLPSGRGFDSGTRLLWEESTENKLVFDTSFHHMDENGYYDGWTHHKVIVTPSLLWSFDLKVTGKNSNSIHEYIGDTFTDCLLSEVKSDMCYPSNWKLSVP